MAETQLNSRLAEPSNIIEFTVHSESGDVILTSGVTELDYYESILDCTIRVSVTVVDSGYRTGTSGVSLLDSERFLVTVGELVSLAFEDNQGNGIILSKQTNNPLMVKQIHGIGIDNTKMVYRIDLWSAEATYNNLLETKVVRAYNDKPSKTVESILRDNLKTQKTLNIEQSQNNIRYIGNKQKPFYSCVELASISTPNVTGVRPGSLAGFFFFETSEGYQFKSIDNLFSQARKGVIKRSYIANNTTQLPLGYTHKIYNYDFSSNYDLEHILNVGSFSNTTLATIDPISQQYEETEFQYESQFSGDNTAGTKHTNLASSQWKFSNKSVEHTIVRDIGSLPQGNSYEEQLNSSSNENIRVEEIIRQSKGRYNQLYSNRLSFTVAGDIGVHAGDVVSCDFPNVSADKTDILPSPNRSGLYMISDLCHRLTTDGSWTRIQCVRDSFA